MDTETASCSTDLVIVEVPKLHDNAVGPMVGQQPITTPTVNSISATITPSVIITNPSTCTPVAGTSKGTNLKRRLTKTIRLQKSLDLTKELVDLSTDKKNIERNYYKDKLDLMKKDQEARRLYESKKLELLSNKNDLLEKLVNHFTQQSFHFVLYILFYL